MDSNLLEYPKAASSYQKIRKIFDFDQKKDIVARDLLFSLRKDIPAKIVIEALRTRSHNKTMIFFGAGPSLTRMLPPLINIFKNQRQNFFLITADGATRALNEADITPDLIVSDLDGLSATQLQTNLELGSIASILGHGDNLDLINKFKSIISTSPNLICTTQVQSRFPIINPGGFTDGDRGLFLFHHITSLSIPFHLIGYDFGNTIGRYSKPTYEADQPINEFKSKKLEICRELLNDLQQDEHRKLIFITIPSQCERFNLIKS